MNVAIIGCGKMGLRRAAALGRDCRLMMCYDTDVNAASAMARKYFAKVVSIDGILSQPDIDIVILSTRHDSLAKITRDAIFRNKHVLVEKPAGRTVSEIDTCINALKDSRSKVRVGFNHRYHRALRKAYDLVFEEEIGELMYVRGRYGHGGRVGYDKEWRADKSISGGGELIDQGVHLIDLSRWFLGEFCKVQGVALPYFWNMTDDNSFMMLQTPDQQVALLHASCTEWKNTFSFEIFGEKGKLEISGLGGSYGVERLTLYKMRPGMGPPDTTIWEYPTEDDSLRVEWSDFLDDIRADREPDPGLVDARAAISIVEEIYRS